ncbi:hypothetical protein BDN71DRAFT_1513796 [Pleurotus eryngii]|uniref:Uncharacterized protein n=1 Tax=Pleurotus eryngii TaxID=5323 RepID=A0A9P5ZHM2_PLEER|nr:hypothetical protein BDN71DRAFT_1513796 [Pleurotus eryngii]
MARFIPTEARILLGVKTNSLLPPTIILCSAGGRARRRIAVAVAHLGAGGVSTDEDTDELAATEDNALAVPLVSDSGVADSLERLSFAYRPRVYREDHSYESRLAPQRFDAPWLQRPF